MDNTLELAAASSTAKPIVVTIISAAAHAIGKNRGQLTSAGHVNQLGIDSARTFAALNSGSVASYSCIVLHASSVLPVDVI